VTAYLGTDYNRKGARESHGCRCPKPRNIPGIWRVVQLRCNHSLFNGGRYTPSAYSEVRCIICGARWRTKAAYVDSLKLVTSAQAYEMFRLAEQGLLTEAAAAAIEGA
jgi:hypothetical protein